MSKPLEEMKMKHAQTPEGKIVLGFQLILLASFVLFVGGLIVWITNLIRLSHELQDVPSASIGISIVAIPVFLTLLGVFIYVFFGLLLNQE
jgi:hypothetical protein